MFIDGTTRVRKFAADSACNVHLMGEEDALKDAKVVHFKVVGTAGASRVTKTGTVVGSAIDEKGEKVEFKFKCSALKGLTMNLLSISQLLTEGSIVHLEKGNSYILVRDRVLGSMRKIVLEESNGLFFLPLEVECADPVSDPLSVARAHLASAAQKLVSDSKQLVSSSLVDVKAGDDKESTDGSEDTACAFVGGSNAATLELWHQRLGCSKQKISLMHKNSSALGLSVAGSKKAACKGGCMCSVCKLSRA